MFLSSWLTTFYATAGVLSMLLSMAFMVGIVALLFWVSTKGKAGKAISIVIIVIAILFMLMSCVSVLESL